MADDLMEIKFHFFDFIFTPYKENSSDTSKFILKSCIDMINTTRIEKESAVVIDKFETRSGKESRNLVLISAAYNYNEKKYKCKIALIRDNKLPTFINKKSYTLTPMDELKNHMLVETTNFYIDMNGKMPVVCCEFNNNGPRVADIEYYFRQISRTDLRLAKSCKAKIHMDTPVGDVLSSIKDVLRFEIKARPQRLAYLNNQVKDSFVANMTALANTVEPKSMRVDAFFRERGNKKDKKVNTSAVSFIKRALKAIKTDNNIIDDFDDFTLEFERNDGTEGVFNLIKGKKEIIVECPKKKRGQLDTKSLYLLVVDEFEKYLNERNK